MGRQERLYAADVATTVEVLPPNIYSGVLFDRQSTRMSKGNQMVLTHRFKKQTSGRELILERL